jgi:hypothetical protein
LKRGKRLAVFIKKKSVGLKLLARNWPKPDTNILAANLMCEHRRMFCDFPPEFLNINFEIH